MIKVRDRPEPPAMGDERETLLGFLRFQRATLEWKCSGLDAEQLARRTIDSSTMSLLGLVRHLADVERGWFRQFMAGLDVQRRYRTAEDFDADFNGAVADDAVVEEAWRHWREEVAFADHFITSAPSLDVTGSNERHGALSLRWLLAHMIEEYARHNGHADLLRERIDGAVGE